LLFRYNQKPAFSSLIRPIFDYLSHVMRGIPKIFSKKRPVSPGDSLPRLKKIRRRRKEKSSSANQKKLIPSKKPFEFGPSNQTGHSSGFAYMLTICVIISLIAIVFVLRNR